MPDPLHSSIPLETNAAPSSLPEDLSSSSPESILDGNIPNDDAELEAVSDLERRLSLLRHHAQNLNSPATFVESAKLERRANAVEKRLKTLKEEEGRSNDNDEFTRNQLPVNWMTQVSDGLARSPTLVERVGTLLKAVEQLWLAKMVVRGILFLLLVWFFNVRNRAHVMEFDCSLVRPLHVFLPKKDQCTAVGDDFVCAVGDRKCIMPFYLWLAICNAVVRRIFGAFW